MEALIIFIILLIIPAVISSLGFLLVLSYYIEHKNCDRRCDQCEDQSCPLNPYHNDRHVV
jgi:hypothetical protein